METTQTFPIVEQAPTHTWQQAWWQALTRPSLTTFTNLANDPTASRERAYKWIFVSGLVTNAPACICAPFGAALLLLVTALYITVIHLSARIFKGSATYNQLAFSMAAFIAPLQLMAGVANVIAGLMPALWPMVVVFFLMLINYWLILGVVAVKATHQLGWGRAVMVHWFIPIFALADCVAIFVVPLIALTQPATTTGNNFMAALTDKDYVEAYHLCSSDLQTEIGSPDNLARLLAERGTQPTDWGWWTSRFIEYDEFYSVSVGTDITFANGDLGIVELQLIEVNGQWLVNNFTFQEEPGLLGPILTFS